MDRNYLKGAIIGTTAVIVGYGVYRLIKERRERRK